MDAEEEECIAIRGIDPGSVNLGSGDIKFYGLVDIIKSDDSIKTIPNIDIVSMERWDITRGIITKQDDKVKKKSVIVLNPPSLKSSKMLDWGDSLSDMISRSDWLFEPYTSLIDKSKNNIPTVLVENQCDFKKTDYVRTQMLQVSNMISSSISAIDFYRKKIDAEYSLNNRIHCMGLTKYGQRSDASRDRPERKEQAVDDLKELLGEIASTELPNATNAKKWLDWLIYMESIKEQIHDMCDGILSAVHKAMMMYKDSIKGDIKEKRALLKTSPRTSDNSISFTDARKKKREYTKKTKDEIKEKRVLLKTIPVTPMRPKKAEKVEKPDTSKRKRVDGEKVKRPTKKTKMDNYPKLLFERKIE